LTGRPSIPEAVVSARFSLPAPATGSPAFAEDDTRVGEAAYPPKQKAGVAAGFRLPLAVTAPLVRGFERFRFLTGDRALDGRLHLLESPDLDLPHAFA